MNNEIKQMLENIPSKLVQYSEIRTLVKQGKSQEALQKLEASTLNSSTKEQLKLALQSDESYVIDRIFGELDAKLANALCWDCWRD